MIGAGYLSEGEVSIDELTFATHDSVYDGDGGWNDPQTVTVTGVDDKDKDGQQSYSVLLVSASDDSDYHGLYSYVFLSNIDDDSTEVVVMPQRSLVTSEDGDESTFLVFLSTLPEQGDVIVDLDSEEPHIVTVDPVECTFSAANWNQPQEVTIKGTNEPDRVPHPEETSR